jgi:hypothetical protein
MKQHDSHQIRIPHSAFVWASRFRLMRETGAAMMKRQKLFQSLAALMLGVVFALSAQAAPKLDPQLGARLKLDGRVTRVTRPSLCNVISSPPIAPDANSARFSLD